MATYVEIVSMSAETVGAGTIQVRSPVMENGYGIIKKFCEGLGYLDGSRRLWPSLKGVTHVPFPSLSHEF